MKKKKRKSPRKEIYKILFTLIVSLLSIYGLLRIQVFMSDTRFFIAERLETVIGREIVFDKISANIFGSITLDNVKIASREKLREGILLDCRKAVIRVNLFRYLVRKQPIEQAISKIIFRKPVLYFQKEKTEYDVLNVIPVTCEVVVSDGIVNIEYDNFPSLKEINGSFKLKNEKNEVKFIVSAKIKNGEGSRIEANGAWRGEDFAVKVDVKNAGLKDYFRLLPGEGRFNIEEGVGDIRLIVNKRKGHSGLFYSGDLLLKKGALSLKDSYYKVNIIEGKLHVDNNIISCDNLVLQRGDSEFRISGSISDFLSEDPRLKLAAEASIELADMTAVIREDWINRIQPLNGRGGIKMEVSGSLDEPVCRGSLMFGESVAAGVKVNGFETEFSYADKIFNIQELKLRLYEGEFYGNGGIDINNIKNPELDLDFNLDGVNFALIPIFREPHKGYLNFKARLSGRLDNLQCRGSIDVNNMEIGEWDFGSVSGLLRYRNERFRFNVKEKEGRYELAVNCLWRKHEKKIDLDEFKMTMSDGGRFELKGDVAAGGTDELNVRADLKGFRLEYIPSIKKYYPGISGVFDFSGRIKGTIHSPDISGLFTTKNMTVNSTGISVETDIRYFNSVLNIRACNISDSYFGNLKVDFTGKRHQMSGKIKCMNADVKVAMNLIPMKIKRDISGIFDGNVEFSGSFVSESLKASGKLSVKDVNFGGAGIFRKLDFEFNIADEKLLVKNFSCINGQGRIDGNADVGLKKDSANKFKIKTRWKNYQISSSTPMPYNVILSGDCDYSGKLYVTEDWKADMSGYVVSRNLTVNEEPVENINTWASYKNNIVDINSFTLGNRVKGRARLNLNSPVSVNSSIRIVSKDIPGFINSFLRKKFVCEGGVKGQITGDISLYGEVDNPSMEGSFKIRNGKFRSGDIRFDLKSKFSYENRVLSFGTSRLKFRKPYGNITVTGNMDFNNENPYKLNGKLEAVPVEILEDIFINYSGISGEVNGSVYARGSFDSPVLRAELTSRNNTVFGYKFKNLKVKLRAQDSSLYVDALSAEYGRSIIRFGRGSVFTSDTWGVYDFSFPVHLRNVGMKNLSLFGELKLEGTADFTGEHQEVNSVITVRDLWVNQWNIAGIKTRLEYRDNVIKYLYPGKKTKFGVKADLNEPGIVKIENFEVYEKKNKILSIEGEVNLKNNFIKGNLKTLNQGVKTGVLAKLLNFKEEQTGRTKFDINIKGNWIDLLAGSKDFHEERPCVEGTIDIEEGNIHYLGFDRLRASFEGNEKELGLKYLQVMKTGKYMVNVSGKLPYEDKKIPDEDDLIKLKMYGENSMQLLGFISLQIEDCYGVLDGEVNVTGSIINPVINGYFKGSNGVIKKKQEQPYLGGKVTDLRVDAVIKNSLLEVREFHGKVGNSALDIGGNISLAGGALGDFDLNITMEGGNGMPVESPGLAIMGLLGGAGESPSKGKMKGELHVYGNESLYKIDGEVELNDALLTYPPPLKYSEVERDDFLIPALWDLKLKTGDNVTYTMKYITARTEGDLEIFGNTYDLLVNGKFKVLDGDIYYYKSNYMIREGVVEIIDNKVFAQGRADTSIPGDTITMIIDRSRFTDLKIRFLSLNDPEMSSEDAVLKVAGMYRMDLSEEERSKMVSQELGRSVNMTVSDSILDSSIRKVSRIILPKILQPDRINVELPVYDWFLRGETGDLPWRFSFGKYLDNEGLYLGYSDGLEGRAFELIQDVDFLSRFLHLPQGGEYIRIRQMLPLGRETIITLEKQVRF